MNLNYLSRRRPRNHNDITGIGYVVMTRFKLGGKRSEDTYKSVRHNLARAYIAKQEYQAPDGLIHNYRKGFHLFKTLKDARAACEIGTQAIVKCVFRNPLAYGHCRLGGHINLDTGELIDFYKAAVVVARHRMIIEEVQ